jgi:hypothetical protein
MPIFTIGGKSFVKMGHGWIYIYGRVSKFIHSASRPEYKTTLVSIGLLVSILSIAYL